MLSKNKAGISMAALPDVEGFREKMEFVPGFCWKGPGGGSLLGVFQDRFSFNVKFRFTIFGPMHSSTSAVARADFWRLLCFFFFKLAFLGQSPFKWFLFPHVKHLLFLFLMQQLLFQLPFASFEFLILDCDKPSNNQ